MRSGKDFLRLRKLHFAVLASNRHDRALVVEILRSIPVAKLSILENIEQVMEVYPPPDVTLWAWTVRDFALLRRLASNAKPRHVILLDGPPTPELLVMATDAGAAGILAKPFSVQALTSHIARTVALPRADDQVFAI